MKRLLPLGFVLVVATTAAIAQQITVDEFGLGLFQVNSTVQVLPSILGPDPTGGLMNWNVLIYTLPFQGIQGDVLVQDPFEPGNPILDVIRFDGNFHLIFYSDSIDGYSAPADTPGPPDPFYTNHVFLEELISGAMHYADYKPGAGQPGGDPSFGDPLFNPSYRFISEIPEPGATVLLLGALGVFAWRRKSFAVS